MKRIHPIDVTRGIVMIIMALDHVRDLMHTTALTQDPTDFRTTTAALFLTRWITHLCAPSFVFLSGASAYLTLKSRCDLSQTKQFLLTRGLWLMFMEVTVINFAFWFDLQFRTIILQVIFAIGLGFVALSFLLKVSARIIGVIGAGIVFLHGLTLLVPVPQNQGLAVVWSFFFRTNVFTITPNFTLGTLYPFIPWLGILLSGYAFGSVFEQSAPIRKKLLWRSALLALSLFVIIRLINFYGDPFPWAVQKSELFTFLSFINVFKYPPSLLYTLLMLGIMFILLALGDTKPNGFTKVLATYGKVPMFYYLLHWYLIHSLMFGMLFLQGFSWKDIPIGTFSFGRPPNSGVELGIVYSVWLGVVLTLYPLCRWYGKYKATHRNIKWLSYL
ncbi:DUF1624 domain-containing protein [Runella slithyformis]|nr:heparan-alpha-glucosaminide N-acetyltransferase domain-containing protein [Runella slithyformis]